MRHTLDDLLDIIEMAELFRWLESQYIQRGEWPKLPPSMNFRGAIRKAITEQNEAIMQGWRK